MTESLPAASLQNCTHTMTRCAHSILPRVHCSLQHGRFCGSRQNQPCWLQNKTSSPSPCDDKIDQVERVRLWKEDFCKLGRGSGDQLPVPVRFLHNASMRSFCVTVCWPRTNDCTQFCISSQFLKLLGITCKVKKIILITRPNNWHINTMH